MHTETLTFDNDRGERLSGEMDWPAGTAPRAFSLFAHCFTCSKNIRAARQISRALTAAGLAVLRFDFTGLGESEGDFAETTFSSDARDLVAAARFLTEAYDAPCLLVGHSLGGAAVLRAAPDVPSVQAVATVAAPCSPSHIQHLFADRTEDVMESGQVTVTLAGRPFTIKKDFLEDLMRHPMHEVIPDLGRPLLILHAPTDTTVGIENAARIYEHARHPKSFISLDDADHLLTRSKDARYAGRIIATWGDRYFD